MGENGKFLKGFFTGIFLMATIGFVAYIGVEQLGGGRSGNYSVTDREHQKKLEYIESLIDGYYLHEADDEKIADGMYAGMLKGLEDPYSRYYSKEEYAELNEETEGRYKGIGVVMQQRSDGLIELVRIYEGTPGEKVGLLAGDILYRVNGEDVTDMELSQVAAKIKTPDSDTATLTVIREGESNYLEFTLIKEEIQIPVVEYRMLDNRVGYLAIYEFINVTAWQYAAAYKDLRAQGMECLVIDLRDNPGGLLDSVCEILETILPEGLIVYTEDKYGNREERTCEGNSPIDIPLAVLVNENSASASEIFAGAVQDYGIGSIVGTVTYGKGVVQSIRQLADGSAVKLTVSDYYTPNGNNIDGTGITPDVEVEPDEAWTGSVTEEEDKQLQKAVEVLMEN